MASSITKALVVAGTLAACQAASLCNAQTTAATATHGGGTDILARAVAQEIPGRIKP